MRNVERLSSIKEYLTNGIRYIKQPLDSLTSYTGRKTGEFILKITGLDRVLDAVERATATVTIIPVLLASDENKENYSINR